jgi:protein-disulfide isomerase
VTGSCAGLQERVDVITRSRDRERTVRHSGSVRNWLDVLSTLAIVAVSGSVLWTLHLKPAPDAVTAAPDRERVRANQIVPSEPLSIGDAQRLGRADAPTVVVQYSDFLCPYCATVAKEAVPALADSYISSGKVQLIFRHLPLDRIHPLARQVAEVAECAGDQGKFWKMHDVLFSAPAPLQVTDFHSFGKAMGLNLPQFQACVAKREKAHRVKRDSDEAARLNITSTPTFLFGKLQADGRMRVTRRASGSNIALLLRAIDETASMTQ